MDKIKEILSAITTDQTGYGSGGTYEYFLEKQMLKLAAEGERETPTECQDDKKIRNKKPRIFGFLRRKKDVEQEKHEESLEDIERFNRSRISPRWEYRELMSDLCPYMDIDDEFDDELY